MKIALITTPANARSGIGDYTRHLLPYLRESAKVDLFVEDGREAGDDDARSVRALRARDYDQVLYQLGNERQHAFMARMIREVGGTVVLHDWVLFDLALAAWPRLEQGGWRAARVAIREGGVAQWRRLRAARRGLRPIAPGPLPTFGGGWHDAEPGGRWCADRAQIALGAPTPDALEIDLALPDGRTLELHQGGPLDELRGPFDGTHLMPARAGAEAVLELRVKGLDPTPEQHANGDTRRLGAFLRGVRVKRGERWEDLRLSEHAPIGEAGLSAARFELPLNRSVVREADAFLVHSEWMADRIRADRNAPTPIGVVHHGAERRWANDDRRVARLAAGLPPHFADAFLLVSLGAVQAHKRIGPLLEGLALARRTHPELKLALVGEERPREFDLAAAVERLGLANAVHCTGWTEEPVAWDLLGSGDLAVNLRGPSSGGASGGAFQAFSMGRAAIVTDAPQVAELPDDVALRVPAGEGEVEQLARALTALADDPTRRDEMERAVRRFVADDCHWSLVAQRYLDAMAVFPAAKSAKKTLFRLVTEYGEKKAEMVKSQASSRT